MLRFSIFSLFFSLIILFACNTASNESEQVSKELRADLSKGFQLAESYCFTCHSPDASIDNRIAPPMIAIKKHYINAESTEESFTADIIRFVSEPNISYSKMPGAVEKFNLMPKMSFSEEDLRLIAQYLYHSDIEAPTWFEEHYQEEKKKYGENVNNNATMSYAEQGKQYAMATKAVLGKNLLEAINTLGTEKALAFCNTKAITLTDSMANVQGVQIKRVSDLNRNPANAANEKELAYIAASKALLTQGQELQPQITESADGVEGYYPIITNTMCLQCHGAKDKDISAATLAKINELYPADLATGYGENELRGIWVVTMGK
ncbi:MAG: DUF3365 domain-containing protein [Chitinophagales bacterium]|nr:DUF3365 domain-containing protein [Chitinophagales bacterium]